MKIETLVSMANQIGDFFKSFPDQEMAKKNIAAHLTNFWARNMRDQIIAHVSEQNGAGLETIVRDAVKENLHTTAAH
jgi:formate dehydrogenase subunit delta